MPGLFRSCFFIIVLLGSSGLALAQSVVQGLLMEKSGSSRVANVSIINKNTGAKSSSNELGLFQISATTGDTLLFSKNGYVDILKPLLSMTDLVLQMQRVIELGEVRVVGQSKQAELEEIKDQYRKKGSYYGGKPPLLSYFFQPLTAIYELVGKTPNRAKRFNLFYIREMEQTEVDRRFNPAFVGKTTNLTGDDLKNFMVMYRPGYESLSAMDDYALIRYVSKSLESFNKTGRPKGLLSLPALPKAPDLTERNLKY
jgi:hypothetical protein